MTRQVIRTIRRVRVDGEAEPVESIHERQVERVLHNGNTLQTYKTDKQLQSNNDDPNEPATLATRREMTLLNSWLQTLQNLTQRQLAVLHDFDVRLTHLEDANRANTTIPSYERATWWALWGLLMLVLGSALVVIIFLIFSSYFR